MLSVSIQNTPIELMLQCDLVRMHYRSLAVVKMAGVTAVLTVIKAVYDAAVNLFRVRFFVGRIVHQNKYRKCSGCSFSVARPLRVGLN